MTREFYDVDKEELDEAVLEMLDKLDIAGSVVGEYDIYQAIANEHARAIMKGTSINLN